MRLTVRVQPRAKKTELAGLKEGVLQIRLNAPAVENRANEALIELLAELFNTPKSRIEITRGGKSRTKTLLLHDVSDERGLEALHLAGFLIAVPDDVPGKKRHDRN